MSQVIDTFSVPLDAGLMVEHWANERDQLLIVPPMSWQAREFIYAPLLFQRRRRSEAKEAAEDRAYAARRRLSPLPPRARSAHSGRL